MCLGIPGQVIELLEPAGQLAKVQVGGVHRDVNTALIEGGVAVGDWVLIHVGFALSVIDEAYAQEVLDTLASLPSFDDELALLAAPSPPSNCTGSTRRLWVLGCSGKK
jgi:hydrogenase expression/formation protein HypC